MAWAGLEPTAAGVAGYYGDILDGIVTDEKEAGGLPVLATDTLMADAAARRRVAEETLRFAESLGR
jgi:LPPG:FO 2-phospho-L-lactate transferase